MVELRDDGVLYVAELSPAATVTLAAMLAFQDHTDVGLFTPVFDPSISPAEAADVVEHASAIYRFRKMLAGRESGRY